MVDDKKQVVPLDWGRYLRVVVFFAGAFASFIWWEIILRRVPGIGEIAARSSLKRWQRTAQHFRRLAVQLGGVLIKLGQFLSIRVDILPPEVTGELAGLQDEVPAESLADIQAVINEEFARPADQVFDWFAPEPEAAASLAQVHRARLRDGQEVVVKVQRRHIEQSVETDLAAIRVAANWLKVYRPITRRVDLDRLYDEFARTTRAEMDFIAEGKNAEHFAADFADNPGIYVADVYWEYTTRRVLTLENVASIKISDLKAIETAGISRSEVARRLYTTYLEQIFVQNFVHADPHPGNLFVRPLSRDSAAEPGTSGQRRDLASRPFVLIFVDFGMVCIIPEALRAGLREYVIGLGTRDSHRIIQAYADAGVLRPGADRKRLEEIHDRLFQSLEGVRMGSLSDVARQQAEVLWRDYSDIIYELPFQFPSDMLFAMRAVGILSGIATSLDPDFDPWAETVPFAERLVAEETTRDWRGWLDEAAHLTRLTLGLPIRLDQFITDAQRGDLIVQTSLAPDSARAVRRLERSVDRLTWAVTTGGLLIAGALLRAIEGPDALSTGLLIAAALAFLWGLTHR
jgi:predicted unusual protein kinase regulating ubiquinone biosynthesis (AarF/ABC1/UbiB family)